MGHDKGLGSRQGRVKILMREITISQRSRIIKNKKLVLNFTVLEETDYYGMAGELTYLNLTLFYRILLE